MRERDKLDLGPEPQAFTGLAHRVAALLVAGTILVAFVVGGVPASLATAVGGALAGLAFLTLSRGLSSLLEARSGGARGRLWAVGALLPRQALLAAALFVAVVVLDLPAGWLLAGVTAWPVALVTAAVLVSILPAAAALAGAGRES